MGKRNLQVIFGVCFFIVFLLNFVSVRSSQDVQANPFSTEGLPPLQENSESAVANFMPLGQSEIDKERTSETGWQIECVDCPHYFTGMDDHHLAVDSQGYPHMAYGGDHLYYVYFDGSEWLGWILDTNDGAGKFASLALDGGDRPHISYINEVFNIFIYFFYNGTQWESHVIDSLNDPSGTSIALDYSGNPHFCYVDDDLKYAHFDGNEWEKRTITSNVDVSGGCSIAVDGLGVPHITFIEHVDSDYDLYYVNGEDWIPIKIEEDTANPEENSSSIAVDSNNHPHVSFLFYDGSESAFGYLTHDGVEWSRNLHEQWGYGTGNTSIAVDANDKVYVVYNGNFGLSMEELYYYVFDAGIIEEQHQFDMPNTIYTSVDVDNSGKPHITYTNKNKSSLEYITRENEEWTYQEGGNIIDFSAGAGGIGYHAISLDVDSEDIPTLAYKREIEGYSYSCPDTIYRQLFMAQKLDGAWYKGRVPGSVHRYLSIGVDSVNLPHMSYKSSCDGLVYLHFDGTNWVSRSLYDHSAAGNYSSLAIDSQDHPHVIHSYSHTTTEYESYYLYNSGENWQEFLIPPDVGGMWLSLAIDSLDHPYFTRSGTTVRSEEYGWRQKDLYIGYYDGDYFYNWELDEIADKVDPATYTGRYNSIALNSNDDPYVSYQSNGDLKLTYWDGAAWQTEIVDSEGNTGFYSSLAIDSQDHLHVAYTTTGQLKYAYYNGSQWQIQDVDTDGYVWFSSLALDSQDQPHIAYIDRYKLDVKYAFLPGGPTTIEANFTSDVTSGIAPLTVNFTDTSVGPISSWLWEFGDGDTSTEANPNHQYTVPGVYTVSLTVSGDGGADTMVKTDFITVYDPVAADFSANPTYGTAPLTVNFTNNSTGDYDDITWDFGDGTSSSSANPSHEYTAPGTYTVTLTVSGNGGSDDEIKTDYITVSEPGETPTQFIFLPLIIR